MAVFVYFTPVPCSIFNQDILSLVCARHHSFKLDIWWYFNKTKNIRIRRKQWRLSEHFKHCASPANVSVYGHWSPVCRGSVFISGWLKWPHVLQHRAHSVLPCCLTALTKKSAVPSQGWEKASRTLLQVAVGITAQDKRQRSVTVLSRLPPCFLATMRA